MYERWIQFYPYLIDHRIRSRKIYIFEHTYAAFFLSAVNTIRPHAAVIKDQYFPRQHITLELCPYRSQCAAFRRHDVCMFSLI